MARGARRSGGMQAGWVRWIAYLVLAALVVVTSCQAWAAPGPQVAAAPPVTQQGAFG